MKQLILDYKGRDDNENMLFKNDADDNGRWFSLNKYEGLYILANDYDSDPYDLVENMDKFKDVEIVLQGHENEPTEECRQKYMLLGRLQMDCDYYLGYGNKHAKYLWANDEIKQINKMKELYNSFANDEKPEWLTWEQILNYEKQLIC